MSLIIDAHSHFMPASVAQHTMFFKNGWSDIDAHLSSMDDCGIDKSVLLYPTSDAHLNMGGWGQLSRVYNEEIAGIIKLHGDRFIGGGILPVDEPQEIKSALQQIKLNGLKIISLASSYNGIYLDDENFQQIFEFAQKENIPLHVHAQIINPIGEDRVKDPLISPVLEYVFDVSISLSKLMMSGVLLKYPDIKIIFAHYGGVLPLVKERFDSTYTMLRQRGFVKDLEKLPSEYFKNIYYDTSGSKSLASLLCALEITDSSHILFGSDFPANRQLKEGIEMLEKGPFSSEIRGMMLGGNLLKLL